LLVIGKDVKAFKLYYEMRHISPDAYLPNIKLQVHLNKYATKQAKPNQATTKPRVNIE